MIPGFIITFLTFPGVIVHEFAHQLMCWLLRIRVAKVRYFQFRLVGPAGYVVHAMPSNGWAGLVIGFGPLLVNTLVGMAIAFTAAIHWMLGMMSGWDYLMAWIGISVAMHSFPSTGDAQSIWKSVTGPRNSILEKMVAVPLIGIIVAGAAGSVFWLDLVYGILMAFLVPQGIIRALAG